MQAVLFTCKVMILELFMIHGVFTGPAFNGLSVLLRLLVFQCATFHLPAAITEDAK